MPCPLEPPGVKATSFIRVAPLLLLLCIATGCSSVPQTADSSAGDEIDAVVRLVTASPEPGTALSRGSILEVLVEYGVDATSDELSDIAIVVAFESRNGEGRTFYRRPRFGMLQQQNGAIRLRSRLSGVWDDPQLARPITAWVYVIH